MSIKPTKEISEPCSSTKCTDNNVFNSGHVLLPPCKVCGEKASGLHYGVNSCEGCKSFFKRSMMRKHPHVCKLDGTCSLLHRGRKHLCAGCRYQRCVTLGMSKQSIRSGRYTLEKRTLDTVEVRSLLVEAKLAPECGKMLTGAQREAELLKIVEDLLATEDVAIHKPKSVKQIMEEESKFLTDRSERELIFGSMKPLSHVDHQAIYEQTGLDVDGRRAAIQNIAPSVHTLFSDFKDFAQKIPGFLNIPKQDQEVVLKGGFTLFNTLHFYHRFNCDERIFPTFNFDLVCPPEFISTYVKLVSRLQQLELTPDEQKLFTAYTIMTIDVDVSLEARQCIESTQQVLLDAFRLLLSRHHGVDGITLFYRCHAMVVDLCGIRPYLEKEYKKMFQPFHSGELPITKDNLETHDPHPAKVDANKEISS